MPTTATRTLSLAPAQDERVPQRLSPVIVAAAAFTELFIKVLRDMVLFDFMAFLSQKYVVIISISKIFTF
jgi:hypothetical protein